MLRLDAVERRERAAEHVIQAPELRGALERDQVGRLLDDADDAAIPSRVAADVANLLLGQVAALPTEPDALLDLLDRERERLRFVLRHAQQMERQPLGRAHADAR